MLCQQLVQKYLGKRTYHGENFKKVKIIFRKAIDILRLVFYNNVYDFGAVA